MPEQKEVKEKNLVTKFLFKEFLDRFGTGVGSIQFINILLMQTGASFFLIGILNGLWTIISSAIAAVIKDLKKISTKTIGMLGVIFGLSFLFMAIGRMLHSVILFSVAMMVSAVVITIHGENYKKLINASIEYKNRGFILGNISKFGTILIVSAIFIGAFLMDRFPETGSTIKIFGVQFFVYGYFLAFELTAISFILGGYAVSFLPKETIKEKIELNLKTYFIHTSVQVKKFFNNKIILTLFIGNTITSVVQTVGFAYYGLFIYESFKYSGFGGFFNVAMIYSLAILTSLFGTTIARLLSSRYGNSPTLVFGTALMAIMPLTFFYNPNLISISMGTIASIIGACAVGIATGAIIKDQIQELHRDRYYSTFSLIVTIPYIISVPILSYIANAYDLRILFLVLSITLLCLVSPLYFTMLLRKEKV